MHKGRQECVAMTLKNRRVLVVPLMRLFGISAFFKGDKVNHPSSFLLIVFFIYSIFKIHPRFTNYPSGFIFFINYDKTNSTIVEA